MSGDSVRFHEVMAGTVTVGAGPPGQRGRAVLDLDVVVPDVRRFRADPEHLATVTGTLTCAPLGGRLPIRSGSCRLLTDAGANTRLMTYDLAALTSDGGVLLVHGVKTVRRGARSDLWADTTTLTTEFRAGQVVVAAGILRISLGGFLRQLTTFRAAAPTARRRLAALAGFGGFFLGQLWQVYARQPPAPR